MISGSLDLEVGIYEAILIFLTFLVGWVGGRAYQRNSFRVSERGLPLKKYYKGINLLLNERPDQAVDVFLKNFEVTRDTVDTYLALGTLFRRRGEASRAIKIHQYLLAKSDLSRPQQEMIQLELARDYFHAGLFDRAQGLLNELVELGGRHRRAALTLLIQIHEQFKEWAECEKLGMMLLKAGDETMLTRIAHYMCEVTEQLIDEGDIAGAKHKIKLASQYDKRSLRVLLLQSKLHLLTGDARDALRSIRRALSLDTDFFPEVDAMLLQSLTELDQLSEYPVIVIKSLEQSPRVELVEAFGRWTNEHDGFESQVDFIQNYIGHYPYWRLFIFLLDQKIKAHPDSRWLVALRQKIQSLESNLNAFYCENCGFESQQRLWHCPSCRTWGKIRRVSEQSDAEE